MYKLVEFDPVNKLTGEVTVQVLDLRHEDKGLYKKAETDPEIKKFISGLNPNPAKMYIHINAMGAGEYYGANRNGDFFPEENLIRYHKTFEEFGHVFRHHVNKDPAKAIGKILFSFYNPRMHRVELVAEIDKELGKDIEDKINRGIYPSTSMATKTPNDSCSICGNRAKSRAEYCIHLSQYMGQLMPDGRKVMAINDAPLRFFDQSIVIKPADVTSSMLQKLAHSEELVIGSAELAEINGLVEKKATFKKLSELIKHIEGEVTSVTKPEMKNILGNVSDLPNNILSVLAEYELSEVIDALSKLGIFPSTKFLAELISYKQFPTLRGHIGNLVVSYIKSHDVELPEYNLDLDKEASDPLINYLNNFSDECSVLPEYVEKRAYQLGYANLRNEFPVELLSQPPQSREVKSIAEHMLPEGKTIADLGKIVVAVAGLALLAKYFLHKKENNTKIILVKQASQHILLAELKPDENNSSIVPVAIRVVGKAAKATGTPTGKLIGDVTRASILGLNHIKEKERGN